MLLTFLFLCFSEYVYVLIIVMVCKDIDFNVSLQCSPIKRKIHEHSLIV